MSSTIFIFDIDGTLVDTRVALRDAYIAAGVDPSLIAEFCGKSPWKAWCTQEIHDKKTALYRSALLKYGKRGPAYPLLKYVKSIGVEVAALTGASASAVAELVITGLLDDDITVLGTECTIMRKRDVLYELGDHHDHVFYVDDNPGDIRPVLHHPKVTLLGV